MSNGNKGDGEDLPHDSKEMEQEQRQAQKELDEVPPHGTDPMHEGP